ncbi:MAG: RNA methyltransferase [Flavobacteriia bacterium]|nr:RNA methyltransferase [Flavobacteriia bacterium]
MEKISKAKIKWIRSLQQKKTREQEGVFVVEGEKMVLEGLEYQLQMLVSLVAHKDNLSLVPEKLREMAFSADTTEMEQLSGLKTPNKLLAVFKRPTFETTETGFELALDSIQDPGNMGTILRLADWFGIQRIVCSRETVDCYNPKVVQASMGAIFRIEVIYTELSEHLSTANRPIYGALLNGDNYRSVSYESDGILLMGNEGNGISDKLLPLITQAVTIPKLGAAESLNVATATAILLAEVKK